MTTVETDSVPIGSGSQMVQNLGPDILYVGPGSYTEPSVTVENGFKIGVGESVSHVSSGTLFGVSEGTSDVRRLPGGVGVYSPFIPAS